MHSQRHLSLNLSDICDALYGHRRAQGTNKGHDNE
jgi:hypothetical protein